MLHALVFEAAAQTEEHGVDLPFPPIAFGIIAICLLMSLLIVTWAFKSVGTRH